MNKDISLVDFVEDILGVKLLTYQIKFLQEYEKFSEENRLLIPFRWGYAKLYKRLWQKYCETGRINFIDELKKDNEEIFKREYECKWSGE